MDYMKAAYDLVDKIIEDTKDISKVEQNAKLEQANDPYNSAN